MIVTADLHLNPSSEPFVREVFREVKRIAKERGDTRLAILGDVFDVRHDIAARLLSAFLDCLDDVLEVVRRVDIVPGNHDQWNLEGRHVLESFGRIRDDRVVVHSIPTVSSDVGVLWLPWIASREGIDQALLPRDRAPYLLGHLALHGAWMNNFRIDEESYPVASVHAAGFRRGLFGHYHRGHFVDAGQTLEYVGSPYQTSYAEAGQAKGVVVFDPARNSREFVELRVGPRHHKIVVDADHPETMEVPNAAPGDKLWVCVRGQMAGTMEQTIAAQLEKLGLSVSRFEVDAQAEVRAARATVSPETSLLDVSLGYVAAQDVDPAFKALLVETFKRVVSP